jgi:hypothetical protein
VSAVEVNTALDPSAPKMVLIALEVLLAVDALEPCKRVTVAVVVRVESDTNATANLTSRRPTLKYGPKSIAAIEAVEVELERIVA